MTYRKIKQNKHLGKCNRLQVQRAIKKIKKPANAKTTTITEYIMWLFIVIFVLAIMTNHSYAASDTIITNNNTPTITNNNNPNVSNSNVNNVQNNSNSSSNSTNSNSNTVNSSNSNGSSSGASSNVQLRYDVASSSAAPSFASNCSSGVASQGIKGGLSAATSSTICRNLMMADAYLKLAGMAKTEDLQVKHMNEAIKYLEKAGLDVKKTSVTGFIAQISSDLSIPLAAVLLVILL